MFVDIVSIDISYSVARLNSSTHEEKLPHNLIAIDFIQQALPGEP